MENLEQLVQKNVVNFCKVLPAHVDRWKKLCAETEKPARALSNYAEQLRHVERAKLKHIDDFDELQQALLHKIYCEIEEELQNIKVIIEQLNHANHELKNKLSVLERSTIDLNWERESLLIKGSGSQPPLTRLLQEGFDFWMFFSGALKHINDSFRSLDAREVKTISNFSDSFKLNFECVEVRSFLAIVQYVGAEKTIV